MAGLTPEMVSQRREMLDVVGEIARDITGVQHDDWFVLGPILATPKYEHIFDFDIIDLQMQSGVDADKLAAETAEVVATLEDGGGEDLPPNKLSYERDWIAERDNIPTPCTESEKQGLADMIDYALDLSDHSRSLRTLKEQGYISQAAAFIGASIMSDPIRQYDKDDLYRRSVELIQLFNPNSLNETQLKKVGTQRQSVTWREYDDWFEASDRWR